MAQGVANLPGIVSFIQLNCVLFSAESPFPLSTLFSSIEPLSNFELSGSLFANDLPRISSQMSSFVYIENYMDIG